MTWVKHARRLKYGLAAIGAIIAPWVIVGQIWGLNGLFFISMGLFVVGISYTIGSTIQVSIDARRAKIAAEVREEFQRAKREQDADHLAQERARELQERYQQLVNPSHARRK